MASCIAIFCLVAHSFSASLAEETGAVDFTLGIMGAFTSELPHPVAAAVAFDLDFRKNFDEDLRNRLGPPIVNVTDLNPRLRIRPYIGTSDSSPALGVRTALDWFLGSSNASTVVGLVGSIYSSISIPISSNAAVFQVPMVSYASTSPALSDKAAHPYFLRTASPDTLQASAQWAWLGFFEIPSTAYLYTKEQYGEGLFSAFFNLATAAGETYRVTGVGIEFEPTGLELEPCQDALNSLRTAGTRFVILISARLQFNTLMYVLEQEGNFQAYQWLTGAAMVLIPSHPYMPSGFPIGMQSFEPVSYGAKYGAFQDIWKNLTVEDLYGSEARERYRLDDMQVTLEEASAGLLTEEDFADVESITYHSPFLFDACYAFVFALNALLNDGIDPASIKSNVLLQGLKEVNFEGVSGTVTFNSAGDRLGSYDLANFQTQTLVNVGVFDSGSGELALQTDPVWAGGTQSRSPPSWLSACPIGFEQNRQTLVCEPCRKGIGCGYQPDVGFPLGILGPMTSVSQEYVAAAVLFDLDFRKNFEPELQQRFGPPIFNITNLDPRLRFKVQVGTSNSQPEVGVNTALDWLQGNGDFYRVAGIVGGYHSAVSTPVSSLATVFKVPMVSWASSSPALSDKNLHPYFSRTAPSDAVQGSAIWAWMAHFGIPSVAFLYTMEPYGAGLYGFVNDIAISYNLASRVHGIAVVHQTSAYDVEVAREACQRIRDTGSKFIVLALSAAEANGAMHVMELENMLYEGFQIFGSEAVQYLSHVALKPSQGLPVGFQQFQPVTRGQFYPAFQDMWRQLTVEDLYSSSAVAAYMLDELQVSLADAAAPAMDSEDFNDPEESAGIWVSFLFDSAYTFVIAINNLLLKGMDPMDIHGSVLLDEVRNTEFEGISGFVQFDENGDRSSKFELWNVQPAASGNTNGSGVLGNPSLALGQVAFYDASLDKVIFLENSSMYWVGGIMSSSVPEELLSCSPGFEWSLEVEACTACPLGWFSAGGREACQACPAGTTTSDQGAGSQSCTPCEAGRYSELGDPNCTSCALGSFSASDGQSACDACPVGTFGSKEGLTTCTRCSGARVTTMATVQVYDGLEYVYTTGSTSNESCGCDRGARPDTDGSCVACGEGLICKGLDGVSVQQGFYSAFDLSIYRCYGDEKRCIGGVPGETCAQGRQGVACADCEKGMRPGSDGTCVDCKGGDFLISIFVGVLVFAFLVGAYHAIDTQNRASQSHGPILCAIAAGQLVTVTQTLGVVNMMAFELEQPFQAILEGLSAVAFNVGFFRMNCLGASSAVAQYTAKVGMIFLALAIVCAMHCVFVALRHGCAFKARRPTLYGIVGTIAMVFYISVTSTVLEPLQCLKHPNEEWTMRSHPGVRCWETQEHLEMFILGILAFVTVPVAVSVAVTAIVLQYPRRMNSGDVDFLKSFSFLFFRYHPKKYWYVLVQFVRGFLVALILLIPEVTVQVVLLHIVVSSCLLLTLRALPWRGSMANVLDCACGYLLLVMVCIIAQFVEEKDRKRHLMARLAAAMVVTILVAVAVALTYGTYCRFGPRRKPFQFFLCHHKAGAGALARLLKMELLDTGKLKANVFVDSDNLEHLDDLFACVCSEVSNLVILASSAVFTRPWCVGEMCTARLASVPTVVVAMHDVQLPDDIFINELPERVSNMEVLTESGMDLPMLQDTMHWVSDLPQLPLPERFSLPALRSFARSLIAGEMSPLEHAPSQPNVHLGQAAAVILYDVETSEAAASSIVLQKMLTKIMANASQHIPSLLETAEDLSATMSQCVVMCTASCLERQSFLQVLLQIHASSARSSLFPVLAEVMFRVPTNEQLKTWMRQPMSIGLSSEEAAKLAEVVHKLFKGIATVFQPNHASDTVLMVGARQIARHLQGHSQSHSSPSLHSKSRTGAALSSASATRSFAAEQDSGQITLNNSDADSWEKMSI